MTPRMHISGAAGIRACGMRCRINTCRRCPVLGAIDLKPGGQVRPCNTVILIRDRNVLSQAPHDRPGLRIALLLNSPKDRGHKQLIASKCISTPRGWQCIKACRASADHELAISLRGGRVCSQQGSDLRIITALPNPNGVDPDPLQVFRRQMTQGVLGNAGSSLDPFRRCRILALQHAQSLLNCFLQSFAIAQTKQYTPDTLRIEMILHGGTRAIQGL
jgi:hypothetical protein